uniref:restriction endonuclease subunit S n=1 Tax=Bifidobacterium adolescentis TaxID=1680 RepID=UPI00359C71B1
MAEQHGKTLVPQIRFAGFTDPWEQRKLGEVARRVTRKNENGDSDLPLTISAQYGLVDQRTFFNSQVASKDMSGYFLLHRGEFAYNKSTSTDSPWGAIKRLEKYDMGCVSTLYICFELLSGDPDFLVTYYETDRWYKSVQLIAAEGARNHGLLNIAPDDFFETQICIPKRIDEQRRIGAFFDRLDSLITLHQRKYDKLCVLKKSMLDKMFPKGGSLYPEIRFAGFTDPWEQRKLGDILQERNVRTSDFESNPIFSLTIEDGITPKTDRYERTSLITKTEDLFKIVSPNEFVTNPMNLRFGAFGYNKNSLSVCVSGYYDVFSIDNDKCSGFWNSYFKTPVALKRFDDAATGSLIEKRRVKYSTLCQLIFLMPKGMGEKKQIGAFFDRLDSLITLHQRKLELLRNIKKSMLDKMFV